MMKKLFATALIGTAILAFAGCNAKTTPQQTAEIESQVESQITEIESEVSQAVSEAISEEQQAVEAPDFSGDWTEPMSGRARISIVSTGENTYDIEILWSSSAFESANWTMTGTYYDSTGTMEYTDGRYFVRTYTDDENYTDEEFYNDGAGYFWMEEEGKLGWRSASSDVDGIDGSTFFERMVTE